MSVPTPCIGLCSTTYGDDVCKGCKRFVHEITEWNAYSDADKRIVWQRLIDLAQQVIADYVRVDNSALLFSQLKSQGVAFHESLPAEYWLFALFRALGRQDVCLQDFGVSRIEGMEHLRSPEIAERINAELLVRAEAQYDMNFGRAKRLLAQWDGAVETGVDASVDDFLEGQDEL